MNPSRPTSPLRLPLLRSVLRFLPLLAIVVTSAGCVRKVIEIDPRFSINVTKVPSWYPTEKMREKFTPAQHEAMNRRGRPDYIRFCWDEYGEMLTTSDFSGRQAEIPRLLGETRTTWLYTAEQIEIDFLDDGGYSENPMTDVVRLVCRYGDPSWKSPPKTTASGSKLEDWTWIDRGLRVKLEDGVVVNEEHFQATGRGTDFK